MAALQNALTAQQTNPPANPSNPFPYQQYAPDGSHVVISPDILNSMQQYGDAAYQASTRQLDPQWSGARSKFDQQMVNQGLAPGSQAYETAYGNFSNSQNDAYAQARNQSLGQGMQAQNQAWQQGYGNASLANELARAHISADAQTTSAASSAGATLGAAEMNNRTAMRGLDIQSGQNDFNNWMSLGGLGNQQTSYNNTLPGMQVQNASPFFNMIPNSNPTPVDVTGAYGINAQMRNNAYNGQMQQSNGMMGSLGQLGAAALPFFL